MIAKYLDLGANIGRGQAFGMMASRCSAAQAEILRGVRDSGVYKRLGLTWDAFCQEQVGISRQRVDTVIGQLEEFGEVYFALAQIVRISPETYREIAPKIEGETIEIEGEMVPIIPENAARIRNAVSFLRNELQRAKKRDPSLLNLLCDIRARLQYPLDKLKQLAGNMRTPAEMDGVRLMVCQISERLDEIKAKLP
ncbi:MAG TPA: hypothetical protein VE959_28655 [Bryobacteraceae bacterium]|nr:hypothetical protein [Bryobacteraceae bacterium]